MRIIVVLSILAAEVSRLPGQQYTITTVAGGGSPPIAVPAASVRLPVSFGVAVNNNTGEVFFGSGDSVMKVDRSGILTRVAGTGRFGFSDDGGPADRAMLEWPVGLAIDNAGNLYIAENAAHRIRRVTRGGVISTMAGTGRAGYSGDGGQAVGAQLNWPTGLAMDASGNLLIADAANHAVRKVSPDGIITTAATGLDGVDAIAADASGNLYIADYIVSTDDCGDTLYSGRVLKVNSTGAADTILADGAQPLSRPRGIAVDSLGNVYVADSLLSHVLKIAPSGVVTTAIKGVPGGVAVDNTGNLYVTETSGGRIERISLQGDANNVIGGDTPGNYWGDGGKAIDSGLSTPVGLAIDPAGNLYIADYGNSRVRKVTLDGSITTVAGNGTLGHSGDGGPAASAQLKGPAGLALDTSGNLYIADQLDNSVRMVSPDGTITTVAGRGDANPPLGDGGPAKKAALAAPLAVAVDTAGNLYIADTEFFLIRKVAPSGIISTIAGRNYYYQDGPIPISLPTGLAVDAAGNLDIAMLNTIGQLSPGGVLTTIAGNADGGIGSAGDGGPATKATIFGAFGLARDDAGNLFVAGGDIAGFSSYGGGYIRKIAPNGIINTIAGNGTAGYSGDGGSATAASFSSGTAGLAVAPDGTVYVADLYNNVVRALRPVVH